MAKGAISWVGFILWFELNVINIKVYPLSRFFLKKLHSILYIVKSKKLNF